MKLTLHIEILAALNKLLNKQHKESCTLKILDDIINCQNEIIDFRLTLLKMKEALIAIDFAEMQALIGIEAFDLPKLKTLCSKIKRQKAKTANMISLHNKTIQLQVEIINLLDSFGKKYFSTYAEIIKQQSTKGDKHPLRYYFGSKRNRAIYLWGAEHFEDINQEKLISACKRNQIAFVLVSVKERMLEQNSLLGEFIRNAHKNAILVGALCGQNHDIVLPNRQNKIIKRLNKILQYNAIVSPEQSFDTVHLDIEPYADPRLKKIKKAMPDEYIAKLGALLVLQLELLERLKGISAGHILIGADFPFWYSFKNHLKGDTAIKVFYKGLEKPVSEHMIDILDYTCVMAYANTIDRCIRYANDHVWYASKAQRPIFVSMNFSDRTTSDEDTFFGKGNKYSIEAIKKIEQKFLNNISFKGIAIHDYKSFMSLLEK